MYILGYLYSLDNPNFKQNVRGEILYLNLYALNTVICSYM